MSKEKQPHPTDAVANFIWDRKEIPPLLWHYTDAPGIIGIARQKALWCSEYRHLNDRNEIAVFAQGMQPHLQTELKNYLSLSEVDQVTESLKLYVTWNVFICSSCADADRNEHWHQYARRAGYALGFSPIILRELAYQQGYSLGPVIYGEERAKDIALAVLRDKLPILAKFKSPLSNSQMNEVCRFVCHLMLSYAPFFKPLSFERENEWRLVKLTGIDGDGSIRLRPNASFGLVGYHEFRLDSPRHPKLAKRLKRELIPRTLIGPGNETESWIATNHVYTLLKQNGFDTTVGESASSLRF